jgi:flavodoxin I
MKIMVLYDSVFGNTEKIAQAIGSGLGEAAEVEICRVGGAAPERAAQMELLVVGSPTRGFRPTRPMTDFLKLIKIKGVKVSAFDTRMVIGEVNNAFLTFMVKLFGYAAAPIASRLKKAGGSEVMPPEGFFVQASEGPLKDGELERAAEWGKKIRLGLDRS